MKKCCKMRRFVLRKGTLRFGSLQLFVLRIIRVNGDELILGPFQGPLACVHIRRGRGVCGTAWAEERTVIVPDVEKFPGHIACSSLSRSEIVVPVRNAQGETVAVLDIDSRETDTFDETDALYLNDIVGLLSDCK